jgi:AraC family transcriptional regulator
MPINVNFLSIPQLFKNNAVIFVSKNFDAFLKQSAMNQIPDIVALSNQQALMQDSLQLLVQKEQALSGGAMHFSIKRYMAHPQWVSEDKGMLIYNVEKSNASANYLELRFCISGNRYCSNKDCGQCYLKPTAEDCRGENKTLDVFTFHFSHTFLNQFVHNVKLSNKKDEVLAFKHNESFTRIFPMCNRKRISLDELLNHSYEGSMENIFLNAKIHELLLYSLECLIETQAELEGFACKFLDNENDREKIVKAKDILLQRIGDPVTIKELSRLVATNECYLKKGFKEIFGTTIFDYYQQQRMEHAKYLLNEKGLSVTDVSALLGYSSISHFSTAFKKHTGLKPCDLLGKN